MNDRHSTPLVQVVELAPDFWCQECGKVLNLTQFSPFTPDGIAEQFTRQFGDQYRHGLS